jgi:uncharacterized RDD family membrane protein YckC
VTDPAEALAQAVAERVIEGVIQALDLNEIISRIDVNGVLDQVAINHVLDRVDVDRLLDRVDVNGIIERADVDAIVRRVDVNALMGRVDVNAVVNRVDVDALIEQTDLGGIIAKSTSGFASDALDTLRSQMVMIDQYADRVVWRAERRKGERPRTPSYAPHDGGGPPPGAELPHQPITASRTDPTHDATAQPSPAGGTGTATAHDTAAPARTSPGVVRRAERRKGERPRTPSHAPHDGGGPPPGAELPHRPITASRTDPTHDATAQPSPADGTGTAHDTAAFAGTSPAVANPVGPTALPHDPAAPAVASRLRDPAAPPNRAGRADLPCELAAPATANPPRALVTRGGDPLTHHDTAAGGHDSQDRRVQGGSAPRTGSRRAAWTSLHGHYAGGASRLAAWIIDLAAATGAFTIALAAVSYGVSVITGQSVSYSTSNWIVATIYVLWLFVYLAYPWSLSGKSLGMAVLGIRVVAKDGTHAGWKRAVVRTLALPLSFILFLGLVPILLQKQNRALHDFIAGTAVVYAWDARAARIRFLAREADAQTARSAQT